MSYRLLGDAVRKAKKEHQCIWCGEPIKAGDFFRDERSLYEGQFQHHRWHPECDKAAAEYFADGESEFTACENERPATCVGIKVEGATT